MDEKSLKEKRERAFAKLGEYDSIEVPKTEKNKDPINITKPILFDEKQYSCKIPMKILDEYWKEGDALQFIRTKNEKGNISIQINYVRGFKPK